MYNVIKLPLHVAEEKNERHKPQTQNMFWMIKYQHYVKFNVLNFFRCLKIWQSLSLLYVFKFGTTVSKPKQTVCVLKL